MLRHLKFSRMELAGSLGDLGTLLPLAVGFIMINGMNPTGIFVCVGLFYIASGLYFKVTCPVEPMKVISAYAIATGVTIAQIQASCFWVFLILMIIGITGFISIIGRYISTPVVRGVQLSVGILLLSQGLHLIMGTSTLQAMQEVAEPFLIIQNLGPLPVGLILGSVLGLVTLLLLDNRRLPAAVVVVSIGIAVGIFFGTHEGWSDLEMGINIPELLPYGLPTIDDFSIALLILALPQIPMTVGNAVIANADLSAQYFPRDGKRVSYKALCISMALGNLGSFFLGGMPLCHGAGGLASRYRFGARTAGSNVIIGGIFLLLGLIFGAQTIVIINTIPLSVLGVLLVFAGTQLALTILDITTRKDFFVILLILGITLASNLAAGFIVGIIVARLLQWDKLTI